MRPLPGRVRGVPRDFIRAGTGSGPGVTFKKGPESGDGLGEESANSGRLGQPSADGTRSGPVNAPPRGKVTEPMAASARPAAWPSSPVGPGSAAIAWLTMIPGMCLASSSGSPTAAPAGSAAITSAAGTAAAASLAASAASTTQVRSATAAPAPPREYRRST